MTDPRTIAHRLADAVAMLRCEDQRPDVELQRARATGYVWGWQDRAGSDERDTGQGFDFSAAYALHCAEYVLDRRPVCLTIRDAYARWRATGAID